MKTLMWMAGALSLGASPAYHVDESRLYPSAAIEHTERVSLLDDVAHFVLAPGSLLLNAGQLRAWLERYEDLSRQLYRHETYVYLRAERDRDDRTDAAADDVLVAAMEQVDAAAQQTLAQIGAPALRGMLASDPALARYAYFLESEAQLGAHTSSHPEAIALLARPTLASLSSSYVALRAQAVQNSGAAAPDATPQQVFEASWRPYLTNEEAFAALLVPIVIVQTGQARLQGFAGAPEAKYSEAQLTPAQVNGVLEAVKLSDKGRRYVSVVAAAAARRLHVSVEELHAWEWVAADSAQPAPVPFPEAIARILEAERSMGAEYAKAYGRLLDPANGRLEWCRSAGCDDVGFSMGYAGMTSGLFYGDYHGTTNQMRALAHEAGHAVHRQFMNEHQPLAVYNAGPKFMFESFAIFNELLLLDHLVEREPTVGMQAFYLRQFLDDATRQVWGSAQEVDLEQSIYAGVESGALRTAADLDAITLKILPVYAVGPQVPQMKVSWAKNRLYFTDPLYDANYLLAGLLALQYMDNFEHHPKDFAARYVALLKNGFTASPQALLRNYLGIDLDDATSLVRDAAAMIDERTSRLERLYAQLP